MTGAEAGPATSAAAAGKRRADDPSDAEASGAKRARLEEVPGAFFESSSALDLRVDGGPDAFIRLDPGLGMITRPKDQDTSLPHQRAYRSCLKDLRSMPLRLQTEDDATRWYVPQDMPGVCVIVQPATVTLMLPPVQGASFAVMHAAPPRELSLRLDDEPLSVAVPPVRTPVAPGEAALMAKWLALLSDRKPGF